jgi:glucokinase
MTGLVADVGGTNTRLGRVGPDGVIFDSIVKHANDDFSSFTEMARSYLKDQSLPDRMVVAVAGPVAGTRAKLTNRGWAFDADAIATDLGVGSVHLLNDLAALGYAVRTVAPDAVEPLHKGADLNAQGQALVIGLGTGFNVSPVDTISDSVLVVEQGHASMPSSVLKFLQGRVPDAWAFETVENLSSGVGMLRLADALGLSVTSAAELTTLQNDTAREAVDICEGALGLLVRELVYVYGPKAGLYFNGSLAQVLLSPERRARVLAPLRADTQFDGQFANIPAFLFTSDYVALGGCAARLMSLDAQKQ